MASNRAVWVGNMYGCTKPFIMLGKFETGQAIKRGEILELTADSSSSWVPLDSNFAMSADIAVANEEVFSGDRMGFYEIMVPRPGDVFEFDIATAAATALGTALYYSSSEQVTASASGTVLGYAAGQEHYPLKQGHLTDDAGPDRGESLRTSSKVRMTFKESGSYWATFGK